MSTEQERDATLAEIKSAQEKATQLQAELAVLNYKIASGQVLSAADKTFAVSLGLAAGASAIIASVASSLQ
jgi:hypothetical protein